ncbi:MAG TPA: response regulator [Caulobacterales bacterium]|nr:response regulator [Caulobacterales bacterium]
MSSVADIQVLIVDDNRQMRFLMRSLLRAAGVFRVAEADGALEAFDLMNRFPVDLVLVDWMMKPIDGIAFTRMVRMAEDSPNPFVPVLMMTAHTEASRVKAARDAGVTGFLKKPISARVLFERMSASLLDTRVFVRTPDYFGPDRRRCQDPRYLGPFRRSGDQNGLTDEQSKAQTLDIEDVRLRA